jgi:hypothetical protein
VGDESGVVWVSPVDLPAAHVGILKGIFTSCLQGLERDLRFGRRLRHPDQASRECSVFERLLSWLNQGFALGPDEAAYAVLRRLAAAADDANGYAAVVAEHDALHGLMAGLEATFWKKSNRSSSQRRTIFPGQHRPPLGSATSRALQERPAPPCVDREKLDLQRGVLDAILRKHPQQLTHREIAEHLFDGLDEPDAGGPFACAVRDLSIAGLLKPQGPLVLPTKAALHIKRLELC